MKLKPTSILFARPCLITCIFFYLHVGPYQVLDQTGLKGSKCSHVGFSESPPRTLSVISYCVWPVDIVSIFLEPVPL